MMNRWLPCAAFFCIAVPPACAQQAGAPITLDVVVAEKSGKIVPGLQQQEFTLLDNKREQKILSFREVKGGNGASDSPTEAVVLIDEVNTNFSNASSARIETAKFFQKNPTLPLPASLAFLSDSGAVIDDKTSQDGNALLAQLNQVKLPLRTVNRSQGFYGAGDRFNLSLRALEQLTAREAQKPGRKLIVWISPGWPLLSGPRVELSQKDQQGIFNSIVRLSGALREARITLYAIDPIGVADSVSFRTTYYEEFLKGVRSPKSSEFGNLGLQVLAVQSGGLVLNSQNDVAAEIAKCLADANDFYELSFESLPGDGPNDYHALEVKVEQKGVTARTRAGYYAQATTQNAQQ